jgi:TolB-like protein/Tfp pilus assembly protein PilF
LSLFNELKRRNVFRVAAGYAVLSWLLLQVADVLKDTIGLPDIWSKAVLGMLLIGFLPVLIFSWIYEMTPEGLKREKDITAETSITSHTAKKLDITVIVLLVVAIGVFAIDKFTGAPANVATPTPFAETAPSLNVVPVVAVLPLQALSTDEEGIFLASGLHDDLLTRLARLQAFKVISRTSVMEYADTTKNLRDIGAELGANFILEGGLQAIGGNVRINAQLINALTDEHLWAETYNRKLTTANLFDVQADIAGAIADAMHTALSPGDIEQLGGIPTENFKAYEAFLRGKELREFLTMHAIHGSLADFREAVNLDPDFGEAWAALSLALIRQYWEEGAEDGAAPNRALIEEARQALTRAQQLDPGSASTLEAEAYFYYYGFRDYSSALIVLGKAEAVAPNNPDVNSLRGYLLRRLGRLSEASDALLRAMELDPNSASLYRETNDTLVAAGRCDEARALITDAIRKYPNDEGVLMGYAFVATMCDRDSEKAIDYARRVDVSTLQQLQAATDILVYGHDVDGAIKALSDAEDSWVERPTVFLMIDNNLAWLYRLTGQPAMAEQALQSARKNAERLSDEGTTSLMQLLMLAALEGDEEASRRFGKQAIAAMPIDAWRGSDYLFRIGGSYALSGLLDEAFSILESIRYDQSYDSVVRLELDPFMNGLRDDPRFQKLLTTARAQVDAASTR